jgi:hypothetical protein
MCSTGFTAGVTGESFQVHHDLFELRLPLTVNNAAGGVAGGGITPGRAVGQEGRSPRAERQSALSEDLRTAGGLGLKAARHRATEATVSGL